MKRQSSKNPLLRISKNGEMRLRNKVGHAILTENTYEDRALNTKLQRLNQHRSRHEQYITSRQLEFANKRISASEERPHTMATKERLPSLGFPLIESSSGRRRAFSQPCCDDSDTEHEKPTAEKAKWEKAIALVRLAVQSRQPKDADSQMFVTQHFTQNPIPNYPKRVLPPLTAEVKPRSHRRKRKPKRLTLPEMLKVSRETSKNGVEDSRFRNLEHCLKNSLRISGPDKVDENATKDLSTIRSVKNVVTLTPFQ